MSLTTSPPVYQVRPRKDKRGVDLISDALSIWSPVVWRAGCSQQRSRLRQVFQPSRATRLGRHYPNREHYFVCNVAGRPGWWVILMFIPFVNFIIAIILFIDIAKSFGKGVGFGIGLILLPVIFFPILGFGSAQYQGGATPTMTGAPLPPPRPVPPGAPL